MPKSKQAFTVVEASISISVLSLLAYIFYTFINTKIDDFATRENMRRIENVKHEIIKYVAENGIENVFDRKSILPIRSINNLNSTKSGYTATNYIEGELDEDILPNLNTKNTKGKVFKIITSQSFNQNIHYQNLFRDDLYINNKYTFNDHNLNYETFSEHISYGNSSSNVHNEKLKNEKNFIAFLVCDDGAMKKNKQTCQAVPIAEMLYKINNLKNVATPVNQIIAIDDIALNAIEIAPKIKNTNKILNIFYIDANVTNMFVKIFYDRKNKRYPYIMYKKAKIGDLIWHKQEKSLYRLEEKSGNKYLRYISSLKNKDGNLNNAKWLTAGIKPISAGTYIQNGDDKIFHIDERLQRFDVFNAKDRELIFDQSNGIFRYYDEPTKQWIGTYLTTKSTIERNQACGGLPCAIPGIRKCGPPSPTNENIDIYGRFIVNDIVKYNITTTPLSKINNRILDKIREIKRIDGIYFIYNNIGHIEKFYGIDVLSGHYVFQQGVRNFLGQINNKKWTSYNYNSPTMQVNKGDNIENAVTNFDLKTFEICQKGVGVFVYNKEIVNHPSDPNDHPFLAVVDGNIDENGINIIEIDQQDSNTSSNIDDKTSTLKTINSNAANYHSLGCMQKNYKMIYYKDESIGHFNTIVSLYSNKPFKVKVKNDGSDIEGNEIDLRDLRPLQLSKFGYMELQSYWNNLNDFMFNPLNTDGRLFKLMTYKQYNNKLVLSTRQDDNINFGGKCNLHKEYLYNNAKMKVRSTPYNIKIQTPGCSVAKKINSLIFNNVWKHNNDYNNNLFSYIITMCQDQNYGHLAHFIFDFNKQIPFIGYENRLINSIASYDSYKTFFKYNNGTSTVDNFYQMSSKGFDNREIVNNLNRAKYTNFGSIYLIN